MIKTPQQIKFEDLISNFITSRSNILGRKGLLEDFLEECEVFYDFFCDRIYEFYEGRGKGVIAVDERGMVHINPHINPNNSKTEHIYCIILSESDYLEESTDVIDYINLGLAHLEEQLQTA